MKPGGWWRRYLDWRQRNVRDVVSDSIGFSVRYRGLHAGSAWADIIRIVAFKRDLLTYDLLCVAIETSRGTVEVDEEMPGYADFERSLRAALGLAPDCMLAVMFPAFAMNPKQIFAREAA